ncbi:ATP-binding protein [Streptomyces sp. CA-111067]|uniref:ATP-binding protein n=1 Tax=Streptomyces sp. CA-111067 TaxID=3240046 RepID=UPI003D950BC7
MTESADHVNRFEGSASAKGVVQAAQVHGGVHFHQEAYSATGVVPRQLRGDVRHFVNRSVELARLERLVSEPDDEPHVVPLVVITGSAGVGKTSLALHWAHTVRPRFPGGELYADLRGYAPGAPATPAEVLGRFIEDLGVPAERVPADGERRETLFRSLLADRRVLIVLDNATNSTQIRPLLPSGVGCLVVATSRDDLSGLVARHGALRLEVTTFPTADSVRLLRAATAEYRAGDRRADMAELARLCAGLPLALRIAAERAASRPSMRLAELVDGLRAETARWSVLTTEDEEGSGAMRSVFEWSYRALSAPAARLFRLLGLHPGNQFGVPAVAALAGAEPPQTRSLLESLVRAHLLERRPAERYGFHDLLRDFAAEQVGREESEQERTEILERCLAWYLHTAASAQRSIAPFDSYLLDERVPVPADTLSFSGYESAFRWYRTESANLVTAIRSAADDGFPHVAWRLAVVLRAVYMHHNAFEDWLTTARIAVDAAARTGEQAGQAESLENLGKAAFQTLRLDEAEQDHRAVLDIRRRTGDRRGAARSVNALGLIGLRRRQLDEAAAHFAAGAEIFGELGDRRWTALMRCNRAEALCEMGRYEEAAQIIEDAVTDFRDLGDNSGLGNGLYLLCRTQREVGRLEAAGRTIDAALAIARTEDNQVWRGHWLAESARVERARDNAEGALSLFKESAAVQRRLGDAGREAVALDGAGEACQVLGRFEEAAKLHRRAVAVYRGVDARWQLAGALENLAGALGRLGEQESGRAALEESLRLFGSFQDPQAVAGAQRVARQLARND